MAAETLIILLPLLALVLAVLSIGGLWYWWTSTREEEPKEQAPLGDRGGLGLPLEDDLDRLRPLPPPGSPVRPPSLLGTPSSPAETLPAARALPLPDSEAVEVMRVLRDLADGSLVVEIGGRRYRSLRDIDDPQVGRRFMGNVKVLARFAQLDKYSVPEAWVEPPADAAPAPPPLADQGWSAPPPPPSSLLQPARQADIQADLQPFSMVEQIEEMLQDRKMRNPALAHRSIHIHSTAGGGVRVEVDGRYYEGVGDVQDDEARGFLQATIREWEDRQ